MIFFLTIARKKVKPIDLSILFMVSIFCVSVGLAVESESQKDRCDSETTESQDRKKGCCRTLIGCIFGDDETENNAATGITTQEDKKEIEGLSKEELLERISIKYEKVPRTKE